MRRISLLAFALALCCGCGTMDDAGTSSGSGKAESNCYEAGCEWPLVCRRAAPNALDTCQEQASPGEFCDKDRDCASEREEAGEHWFVKNGMCKANKCKLSPGEFELH
ncbi:MAG: hypothetical protein H6707_08800 [Deltaproteobacteria bacterium]|nr:hypothetical protein [Deltaproteobacteria bacterium]